jgi:hypothetical protein
MEVFMKTRLTIRFPVLFFFAFIVAMAFIISADAAEDNPNIPIQHANQNSIKTCFETIREVSNFLIENSDHSAKSTWNLNSPDQRLFNSLIIKQYADAQTIITFNVTPTWVNTCDTSYQEIFYFNKSCAVSREEIFKAWKYNGDLKGVLYLSNDEGNIDLYLMPAGTGCIVVRQEVVYTIKDTK